MPKINFIVMLGLVTVLFNRLSRFFDIDDVFLVYLMVDFFGR